MSAPSGYVGEPREVSPPYCSNSTQAKKRRRALAIPPAAIRPANIKAHVPDSGTAVTVRLPVAPTLAGGEIVEASQRKRKLSTDTPDTSILPVVKGFTSVGIMVWVKVVPPRDNP